MSEYPPDYCPCGGSTTTGCDPNTFCWSHYRHESDVPVYMVCLECGHVFQSAEDLEEAEEEKWAEPGVVRRTAEQIYACPFCCHDW